MKDRAIWALAAASEGKNHLEWTSIDSPKRTTYGALDWVVVIRRSLHVVRVRLRMGPLSSDSMLMNPTDLRWVRPLPSTNILSCRPSPVRCAFRYGQQFWVLSLCPPELIAARAARVMEQAQLVPAHRRPSHPAWKAAIRFFLRSTLLLSTLIISCLLYSTQLYSALTLLLLYCALL